MPLEGHTVSFLGVGTEREDQSPLGAVDRGGFLKSS